MILVYLLIGIMPFKRDSFWNETGGEYTMAKVLGAVCLVYAIWYLLSHARRPAFLGTWQIRWYVLFMCLVYIASIATGAALSGPVFQATSLVFLYIVIISTVDTIKRLRWTMLTIVGSLAYASLHVFREWQKASGWATGARAESWVVSDSNTFAVTAMAGITLAYYMCQGNRPKWEKLFCVGCALITSGAVLLGASRGGFLGLGAAVLYAAWRSRKRFRNLVIVAILVGGFNIAYPYSPLYRLLDPSRNDLGSTESHSAAWLAGLSMISSHPLTGIGIGMFKANMMRYVPAWYDGAATMGHNAYIEVAAEMGIPTLLAFMGVLFATFISLERIRRKATQPQVYTAAIGLQAALIGSIISTFSISGEFISNLWLIIFLSACLPGLQGRLPVQQSEPSSAETTTNGEQGVHPAALSTRTS